MTQANQYNIKPKAGGRMPVVGIRVPSWASFTRPIFRGIVESPFLHIFTVSSLEWRTVQ